MNLLIITRKIDSTDRASFFLDWLREFAGRLTTVYVICQELGQITNLPANIKIYSLGKEKGRHKLGQLFFLYFYIFKFLFRVQGVFAHMMPIYAVLVGLPVRLFGKKLILWYTHAAVDSRLKLANLFVSEFVTASEESFLLKTKKKVNILGHGINLKLFNFSNKSKIKNLKSLASLREAGRAKMFNLLTIGRVSPTKDYESMIKAVYELKEEGIKKINLKIIGQPAKESDKVYLISLKTMVKNMRLDSHIEFLGAVPHDQIADYFYDADLFINLSGTGSLDKAVLEAMAVGTLPLTSNIAFDKLLPAELKISRDNYLELAEKIKFLINLDDFTKNKWRADLRREIETNHNLENLIQKIIALY